MWFCGRGKADRAIAAYQRELVDTHYREVENMYRQMRMWRHDYRNHLQTMKALDTPIKSGLALIHILRCRRSTRCRSWCAPYLFTNKRRYRR